MTTKGQLPKWTVLYNVRHPGQTWVGTGWEFYNSEITAHARYHELSDHPDYTPSVRPYHNGCDFKHLGAAHQMQFKDQKPLPPPVGKSFYPTTIVTLPMILSPEEAKKLMANWPSASIGYWPTPPQPFHIRDWDLWSI